MKTEPTGGINLTETKKGLNDLYDLVISSKSQQFFFLNLVDYMEFLTNNKVLGKIIEGYTSRLRGHPDKIWACCERLKYFYDFHTHTADYEGYERERNKLFDRYRKEVTPIRLESARKFDSAYREKKEILEGQEPAKPQHFDYATYRDSLRQFHTYIREYIEGLEEWQWTNRKPVKLTPAETISIQDDFDWESKQEIKKGILTVPDDSKSLIFWGGNFGGVNEFIKNIGRDCKRQQLREVIAKYKRGASKNAKQINVSRWLSDLKRKRPEFFKYFQVKYSSPDNYRLLYIYKEST